MERPNVFDIDYPSTIHESARATYGIYIKPIEANPPSLSVTEVFDPQSVPFRRDQIQPSLEAVCDECGINALCNPRITSARRSLALTGDFADSELCTLRNSFIPESEIIRFNRQR